MTSVGTKQTFKFHWGKKENCKFRLRKIRNHYLVNNSVLIKFWCFYILFCQHNVESLNNSYCQSLGFLTDIKFNK